MRHIPAIIPGLLLLCMGCDHAGPFLSHSKHEKVLIHKMDSLKKAYDSVDIELHKVDKKIRELDSLQDK